MSTGVLAVHGSLQVHPFHPIKNTFVIPERKNINSFCCARQGWAWQRVKTFSYPRIYKYYQICTSLQRITFSAETGNFEMARSEVRKSVLF